MLDACSLAARVAVAGVLLAAVSFGPSTRTAIGADDPLMTPEEVEERFDEYRRRLLTVLESIKECDRFADRYGDLPQVRNVLSGLDQQPGDVHFLQPSDMQALEDAVGDDLDDLFGLDLERCVQVRDLGARARPHGVVAAALRRCVRAIDRSGPNEAVVAHLGGVARGVADDTFTSARTLARLEQAVGDLPLAAEDLEICVDAFHTNAVFDRERESLLVSVEVVSEEALAAARLQPVCDRPGFPTPCGGCVRLGRQGLSCWDKCCAADQVCRPLNIWDSPPSNDCQAPPDCFPGTAKVRLEDGSQKAMPDVRLGDRVMVARADGSLGYEEVYLNTHKDPLSAAPYVELTLASGRSLVLSPRHFIPVAAGPASAWAEHVAKGANEIAVGDIVWSRADDGRMVPDEVAAVRTTVAVGAYNPLTMNGTIVVDGVVASAHSDWFLDGIVSADAQAKVYQAILAPVRLAYRALGPARMETITEDWGVVDFVREATTPNGRSPRSGWVWPGVVLLAALGAALLWRRRSAAH